MKKLIIVLSIVLLLVGCSAKGGAYQDSDYVNYSPSDPGYAVSESEMKDNGASGGYYVNSEESFAKEEKLVYTGSITMETKDYDNFSTELNGVINKFMGIVEQMREQTNSYGNYNRTLSLTLRIPAADFNNFIEELRNGSGSVIDVNTRVDNITKAYNNNEIEIEALETQHTRLLELLSEASSLEDIIKLEERISQIEIRLTQLKQYKNEMDTDVAYSTITLFVNEVKEYTETSYWQRLMNAFGNSWIRFVDNVGYFLIDVVYAIPTVLVIIVAFFILRKPAGKLLGKLRKPEKNEKRIIDDNKNDNEKSM